MPPHSRGIYTPSAPSRPPRERLGAGFPRCLGPAVAHSERRDETRLAYAGSSNACVVVSGGGVAVVRQRLVGSRRTVTRDPPPPPRMDADAFKKMETPSTRGAGWPLCGR